MSPTNKISAKEIILPILVMIFAGGTAIGTFSWTRSWNDTLIQPVTVVAGEETSPTVGRLISFVLFLVISLFLVWFANQNEQYDTAHLMPLWCFAAFGGTMLWTSIGESSWHFGVHVRDTTGQLCFVNFPRIESIQGVLLFLMMMMVAVLVYRTSSFSMSAYLFVFLGNWGSHLCQIATYPLVLQFRPELDVATWYSISGVINAVVFTIAWAFLTFGNTKVTTKYLASIFIYDAIGSLLFGTILKET